MQTFLEVGRTGLDAVLLHRGRSAATILCVLSLLLPYLVGLGISKGIQDEARRSVDFGSDLYVTRLVLGAKAPIPLNIVAGIRLIEGVKEVVPRIVGEITLGKEHDSAVLLGVPVRHFPAEQHCVRGRLYGQSGRNELVIGTELARRLGLDVGSVLPPFYHNTEGDRLSEVVGIFESDASQWQANLIVTSFETAAAIFDQQGMATDLVVYCQPGYDAAVRTRILQDASHLVPLSTEALHLRITTRAELRALLDEGLMNREGIFNVHYVMAFSAAILVILVTSGFGLVERRREIGILKATGWQTDQVRLRWVVQSLLLSMALAGLAVVLGFAWLRWFNGFGVAGIFIAGAGAIPAFPVPFRLTPVPVMLAFFLSSVLVLSGSVFTSWRIATAQPREALR